MESIPLGHHQRLRWGIFLKTEISKIIFRNVGLLGYFALQINHETPRPRFQ